VNATVDSTGSDMDTCQLQWNNSNETMTKSGSGTSVLCYINKTILSDGLYIYKVFANDTASNEIGTESMTVTVDTKPKVEGVIVDDSSPDPADKIDLIGNNTMMVWCNATFNDPDGADTLDVSWARIYDELAGGSNTCTGDNNNCYYNSSCEWEAYNATAKKAVCTSNFWFNAANSTTLGWICNITANDTDNNRGSGEDTTDVNPLLAIHVDDYLNLGSVPAGTNQSTCSVDHNTWNYGNVQIDLQLNGTALDCPSPYTDIPVGYIHYNCYYDDLDYGSETSALTSTPDGSNCNLFDLSKNSTATTEDPQAPSKQTYWGVGIPTGSGGTCTGTIHFTAVAG
jgi:hypothetical protein